MNCAKMRHWIYLNDAGELGAFDRRRFRAHMRRCAECRSAEEELHALRKAALSILPDVPLTPVMLDPIVRAARVEAQRAPGADEPAVPRRFVFARRAALAAAVLAVAALGVLRFAGVADKKPVPDDWTDAGWMETFGRDLADLGTRVAGVRAEIDQWDDLDAMATELLWLEGEEKGEQS